MQIIPGGLSPEKLTQKEANFYASLEPGIVDFVRHLRNLGFNTNMSCHHKMMVVLDFIHLNEINNLYGTVFEYFGPTQYFKLEMTVANTSTGEHRRAIIWLNEETQYSWECKEKFPDGQRIERLINPEMEAHDTSSDIQSKIRWL